MKNKTMSSIFGFKPVEDTSLSAIEARLSELESRLALRQQDETASSDSVRDGIEQLRGAIRGLADRLPESNIDRIVQLVLSRVDAARPWVDSVFVPKIGVAPHLAQPYMASSTCSVADILSEEFSKFCSDIRRPVSYHRKYWEWAFIVHHLRRLGMLESDRRGLVFGVGTEPLPSLFAASGAVIVATDAPPDHAVDAGWTINSEYAAKIEDIRMPDIIDVASFAERVSYATCDMNNIAPEFTGFDFCWSSCCFEHLGSLEAGMDFVVNSVEQTLKVGGVACHTTEFNLSSDDETVDTGPTVIYRKQDMLRLVQRLRDRGHEVTEFTVAPDHHPLDFFVDVPPYWRGPHLRLRLLGYTVTSLGLVIRRGR